jgi:3-deoxy-D-manno-octulosonate 8-phosphate phosphatase (KDO 8-P phosphatase)
MPLGAKRMKLQRIRALVLDVDGVLTDGGIYLTDEGHSMKRFDVKDGMGLVMVQRSGVRAALVSMESGELVEARARKLGIADVYTDVQDKLAVLQSFLKKYSFKPRELAYVGDDITDLLAMNFAGVAICPSDAHPQVRRAADWVTRAPGGRGCVREVADAILKARTDSGR